MLHVLPVVIFCSTIRRAQSSIISYFRSEAGVRQGCVLAPESFATGMDWLLDRTVESCSIGVAFGQSSFTDLFSEFSSYIVQR